MANNYSASAFTISTGCFATLAHLNSVLKYQFHVVKLSLCLTKWDHPFFQLHFAGIDGNQTPTEKEKTTADTSSASYDSYLFRSLANQYPYYQYPDDKKFVQEKAFHLNEGEFDHIRANINNRGWGELTSSAEPASKQLAMEFFANAYQELDVPLEGDSDEAKYTSYVRGKNVPYTPAVINQLLGLQNIEQCGYEQRCNRLFRKIDEAEMAATLCSPGKDWDINLNGIATKMKTTKLNPTAKAWATFVLHNLLSSSNVSELTIPEAILVMAIMVGEPINIGRILATELHETASCDAQGPWLNHASLIGHLCELVGVKAKKNEALIKPGPLITKKWIDRYCIPVFEIPAAPKPAMDHTDADPQKQHLDRLERLQTRMQHLEMSQREGQGRLERGMFALYRALASSHAGHAFDPLADIFAHQFTGETNGPGGELPCLSNRPPIVRTYSRRKSM